MSFIIDGEKVSESFFWSSLSGIAGERQIYRLIDGGLLNIGGVTYHIEKNAD